MKTKQELSNNEPWNLSAETGPRWIFPERPEDTVNQIVDFYQSFVCETPDPETVLRISADTDFVVWLNGTLVGHGQYSDYPDQKTYECFCLDKTLKPGENKLAVTVFYNGRNSSVYRKGAPGLLFEVGNGDKSLAASGTDTLCRPSPSYHSGPIATVSGQLFYTFGYDARGEDGFNQAAYVPGNDWRNITPAEATLPADRQRLSPRPVSRLVAGGLTPARLQAVGCFRRDHSIAEKENNTQVVQEDLAGLQMSDGKLLSPAWQMQHDYLSARSPFALLKCAPGTDVCRGLSPTTETPGDDDGIYLVVDMGREEVGYLTLEIEAPEGTRVDIGYGEHLDDLRVRTFVGGRNFGARYICREGRQSFTHHFQRWAGRYLAVHIQSAEFCLHQLALERREYPVENRGELTTGNPLHERLLQVARRTLFLCMHEHYEDTPWREQALYANDARTQALCGYYAFGETAFPASSFSLLGRGLRDDGFLFLTAPGLPGVTIPSFTFAWMLAVRDQYLYSGDDSLARQFLPQMLTMLENFLAERQDGLLPLRRAPGIWHFYDWSGGMSNYSDQQFEDGLVADAPLNCFFILALEAAADICDWLEETNGKQLLADAAGIRERVTERFWDGKEQLFRTHEKATVFTELTQALAILAGAGTDSMREAVIRRMNLPESGLEKPGLSQSLYTFQARLTRKDLSGQAVLRDIEDTWGAMLEAGATTFWETTIGAPDFHNAGSLCHAWSAVPLYVFYHDFLGIQPLEPGFRSFAVDPVPGVLPSLSGTVPVPGGTIQIDWRETNGQFDINLDAPDFCKSEINNQ